MAFRHPRTATQLSPDMENLYETRGFFEDLEKNAEQARAVSPKKNQAQADQKTRGPAPYRDDDSLTKPSMLYCCLCSTEA